MTILETAAKAMYARNAAAASGRPPWDKATEQVRAHMVELVRAAVEAIREPTEGMMAAGAQVPIQTFEGPESLVLKEEASEIFAAMIDAALKEDKTQ